MAFPFWAPEGTAFIYRHPLGVEERITFVAALGSEVLHFVGGDGEVFRVPHPTTGELLMTTVGWAIEAYTARRLFEAAAEIEMMEGRKGRFLHLDRAACEQADPKSGWRYDWAMAAIAAAVPRSETHIRAWIGTARIAGRKPNWRSLLRWVAELRGHDFRIGALVSTAGRLPGESQLSDVEDNLVHLGALWYWARERETASKDDAAAMVVGWWDELVERGVPGLAENPPSAECVRERINSLENYTTYAQKFGRAAADKLYSPSGEPVPVAAPFERIYVDGTEYEHSVHYAEDWKLPYAKLKGVAAMCAFSQYVFPHPVFAGPYRAEMGMRAIMNVMIPPELTPEDAAEDPHRQFAFSQPADVMYDNDKAMLPPGCVPGLVNLTSTVELAEAYHHDAKSKLENYHKFVKGKLRGYRGRVLGPRNGKDPRYDPIAATELTRVQYMFLVENARREWNYVIAKKSLGNRTPWQVLRDWLQRRGPRLVDPREVERHISRNVDGQELTDNGLVFDNVHYRWNREGVGETLSANQKSTPFAKRLKGTAKVIVSIRVWDDNVDLIEVHDKENGAYHRLWSTDPEYTSGLSRWEHHQFQKMLRAGGGGAVTGRTRLRNKRKILRDADEAMPAVPFRARGAIGALIAAEETRRASGARAARPDFATALPALATMLGVGGERREDLPSPPPQPKPKKKTVPGAHKAPPRPDDYGTASVAREAPSGPTTGGDALATETEARKAPANRAGPASGTGAGDDGTDTGKARVDEPRRSIWDFDGADDDLDADDHEDEEDADDEQ